MSTVAEKPATRASDKPNKSDDGMRKAAILVSALDRDTVDTLLDQMGPAQASLVRQAVIELDDIDPEEQEQVIREFFRLGPNPSQSDLPQTRPGRTSGVELDEQLAQRLASQSAAAVTTQLAENAQPGTPSFEFLAQAESERLANILLSERPQTIALVLSHIPPERAGHVLVKLPAATQAEVVRRLVDLEETDAEILREVEQELQQRLSQQIHMERRRVAGVPAVAGILEASDNETGSTILNNLAAQDRRLAQRFARTTPAANSPRMLHTPDERFTQKPVPVRVDFGDLAVMDADTLYTVVEAVQPQILVLALLGAPAGLMERMLRQMPNVRAAAVRREIENIGPVRLGDVEEARRRIVETVERLHAAGRIKLQVGRRGDSIGLTA